jgi:hypothetical protein
VAFRGDSTDTYTYASGSTGGTVDLGARNNYRYVNASNVYNKGKADGYTTHTGTYTFAVNDTGGTKDLGVSHTYRYVNATNVYNAGKNSGSITNGTLSFANTTATVNIGQAPKLIYISGPYDGGVRNYSFIYDPNHSTTNPIIARYAYQGGSASRGTDVASGQAWSADGITFTLTVNNTGFTFSINWGPFRQATNYYGVI